MPLRNVQYRPRLGVVSCYTVSDTDNPAITVLPLCQLPSYAVTERCVVMAGAAVVRGWLDRSVPASAMPYALALPCPVLAYAVAMCYPVQT
eukprot:561999-Rhodomonas_salina.1